MAVAVVEPLVASPFGLLPTLAELRLVVERVLVVAVERLVVVVVVVERRAAVKGREPGRRQAGEPYSCCDAGCGRERGVNLWH